MINNRGHRASICTRACAGIPDETLEDPEYSVKKELESLYKASAERTLLYVVLKELLSGKDGWYSVTCDSHDVENLRKKIDETNLLWNNAREAIAAVEAPN